MGLLDALLEGLANDKEIKAASKGKPAKSGAPGLNIAQATQFVKAAVAVVSTIGLPKLIEMFKAAGLDKKIMSWINAGKSLPISGEEVQSALGKKVIDDLAQKTGMEKQSVAGALAKYLPKVIETLTPNNKVDEKVVERETAGFDLGDLAKLSSLAKTVDGDMLKKAGGLLDLFLKNKA